MAAYYSEIDPFAAAWLRELIKAGHIAPGDVDERSIEDVAPGELVRYTQRHFFAGVGVWSYALRQAGWPDDRPVWTGSCPCQPFSVAGKGGGTDDPRHLWPAFFWHIRQCRPDTIFGEQVGGKAGEAWLDYVCTDLEGEGYRCGPALTAACGFGAPHIRKRIYWVADAVPTRRTEGRTEPRKGQATGSGGSDRLGNPALGPQRPRDGQPGQSPRREGEDRGSGVPGGVAHANDRQRAGQPEGQGRQPDREEAGREQGDGGAAGDSQTGRPSPLNGFWRDADWLGCRDGKWRPAQPGLEPLASGSANRVGRLRGYGNALCAPQAVAFVESYMETVN